MVYFSGVFQSICVSIISRNHFKTIVICKDLHHLTEMHQKTSDTLRAELENPVLKVRRITETAQEDEIGLKLL